MSEMGINSSDGNADDSNWEDARRVEAWAAEIRVNLIRILALVIFYGRHLIEYFLAPHDAPVRGIYHQQVTWVVAGWAAAAGLLHWRLVRRQVSNELKYLATFIDTVMLTLLISIGRDPRSPLIALYFLLIACSPLRLSLRHVYVSMACAVGGYLFALAHYAWYVVGFQKYYATPELRIPRRDEAIVVLALIVAGLFAAQCVRQVRRMMDRPIVRVAHGVTA